MKSFCNTRFVTRSIPLQMKTDQFYHSFIRAMKPLYYVSKPLGLAPFGFNRSSAKITTSLYERAYCLFVLAAALTIVVVAGAERYQSRYIISTVKIGNITEILVVTLSCALILTKRCFSTREDVSRIVNKIAEIDRTILSDWKLEYNRSFKLLILELVVLLPSALLLFTADLVVWTKSVKNYEVISSLMVYPYYGVIIISDMQFCNLVLWIRKRVVVLNRRLLRLWQRTAAVSLLGQPLPMVHDVAPYTGCLAGPDIHGVKLASDAEEVRTLRQVHDDLCDLARLMDAGYGLPILGCLATHFINCITSLNLWLSIKLQYQVFSRDKMDSMVYVAVMWSVVHVGGILAITWSCSTVANETRRTADLVNKALLAPVDHVTRGAGASVRRQLKLFSLQLLHRRLRFTACGLFKIDLSNLTSMVTGVVSYLVIFVQFNDTEVSAQACNSD